MSRLGAISGLLARAAQGAPRAWASSGASLQAAANALLLSGPQTSSVANGVRSLHTSLATCGSVDSTASKAVSAEPPRTYRSLADKELWHEAWMYEDKFGSEDDPIIVPSLEGERIIGVTDPEDDNLVVWGILKEGEPPRQFVEGGEFYLLTRVDHVKKVGDVLEELAKIESGAVKAA